MPTKANTYIDKALSNYVVKRVQDPASYIGKEIFVPDISKDNENKIWVRDKSNFRRENSKADAATPGKFVDFDFSDIPYTMDRHKLRGLLDDDTYGNMAEELKAEARQGIVDNIMDKLDVEMEYNMLTSLTTATNYPTAHRLDGSTLAYIDGSNVDIFTDIFEEMALLLVSKGIPVNTFACSYDVWASIRNNGDYLARLNNNANKSVSVSSFKDVLSDPMLKRNFTKVLVSQGVELTSDESAADTFDFIAPSFVWMGYVNPNANNSRFSETFGKTMISSDVRQSVQRYRPDDIEAEITKVIVKYKPLIVSNECGVLLSNPLKP